MCSYFTLNANAENHWEPIRDFLEGKESYFTEITGDEKEGYKFYYVSSTTRYESGTYFSHEAATEGLKLALLRSLILNSPLSAFVSNNTDIIVAQTEKNISQFGWLQGKPKDAIEKTKALWEYQRAFDFKVYVQKEAG